MAMDRAKYAEKLRENRLRRMAHRQGLAVKKSRSRDPYALGFGCYFIVNTIGNYIVAGCDGGRPTYTLDDVERWLCPQNRPKAGKGKVKHGK